MKSKLCSVVLDLLPLYSENLVSSDTKAVVDEHLEECEECKAEYTRIGENPMEKLGMEKDGGNQEEAETEDDLEYKEAIKKGVKRLKRRASIRSVSISMAIVLLVGFFGYKTVQYVKYYVKADAETVKSSKNIQKTVTLKADENDSKQGTQVSFKNYSFYLPEEYGFQDKSSNMYFNTQFDAYDNDGTQKASVTILDNLNYYECFTFRELWFVDDTVEIFNTQDTLEKHEVWDEYSAEEYILKHYNDKVGFFSSTSDLQMNYLTKYIGSGMWHASEITPFQGVGKGFIYKKDEDYMVSMYSEQGGSYLISFNNKSYGTPFFTKEKVLSILSTSSWMDMEVSKVNEASKNESKSEQAFTKDWNLIQSWGFNKDGYSNLSYRLDKNSVKDQGEYFEIGATFGKAVTVPGNLKEGQSIDIVVNELTGEKRTLTFKGGDVGLVDADGTDYYYTPTGSSEGIELFWFSDDRVDADFHVGTLRIRKDAVTGAAIVKEPYATISESDLKEEDLWFNGLKFDEKGYVQELIFFGD